MTIKHKSRIKPPTKSSSKGSWDHIIDSFAASWKKSSINTANNYSSPASTSNQLKSKWFDCKTTSIKGKSILNNNWRNICSLLSTTISDTDKAKPKSKSKPKTKPKKVIKKVKHGSKTTNVSIIPKEKQSKCQISFLVLITVK